MALSKRRERLEAHHTAYRITELRLNPVRGKFDAAHLKEINRRIFQDLPALGFADVSPGDYRPALAPGNDWIKVRRLETVDASSNVAYSAMDKAARVRLDQALQDANPIKLAQLKLAEFVKMLGKLYVEIDYIHPFSDGNSRTLREFTRELAEVSGYCIEWERFDESPAGRDLLYIARDLSVNKLALPHIQHAGTKRDVVLSMDQFEGNRDLPDLLRDVIHKM
ncbi:MAG: Fic family protein [Pseudomonadales bacterium]|jgi:cell filamentation protein|nr:Fic family protein [Pseudomonadales bacterium]